ncbi:hypothetical protein [Kitasatospora sp. NPDC048538]|uniref:hypothetical protein n=1 Tax=unclassified Kitasatospora TaxID=2633591 RepID=UPI0033C0F2BB
MTDDDDRRLLALYLNDHLAGAYGGAALARRIAREHPDTPELWRLATEITEDRDTLVGLMRALGVRPRWHRMLLGTAAEKAGRLKLNGRVVRRSPLSDLLEAEAMRAGVQGKIALWRALRATAASDGPFDSRLRLLEERAGRQAGVLDARQAEAAEAVLRAGLARSARTATAPGHAHPTRPGPA